MKASKLAIFVTSIIVALTLIGHASAARTLHRGSRGPDVKGLQWMLGGHRPSVYTKIATYKNEPNGLYGQRTARAVYAMKFRLGWPRKYQCVTYRAVNAPKVIVRRRNVNMVNGVAGTMFQAILRGDRARPACWIAVAAARVAEPLPGELRPCQIEMRNTAISQIGVQEHPYGSNRGLTVGNYQSITGAYGAAWCVSFAQWVTVKVLHRTLADRTAGVFYAVGWAQRNGVARARPQVGVWVAFMEGQGHMGIVVKVLGSGIVTVEGNASNQVLERYHPFGSRRMIFIYPKDCVKP